MLPSNEVKMSSLDFLNNYINPSRLEADESVLRNGELLRKIELECDDLGGLQIFCNPSGTNMKYYDLTKDQMMLVGMRESKTVRKSVLAKLKQLTEQPQFELPKTFAEALRLAADQQQQLDSVTAQSVAKSTPQSLSALLGDDVKYVSSVYAYLAYIGYIKRDSGGWVLTKKGIDSGYGVQISRNGVRWIPELIDTLPQQAFEMIPLPAPKTPRLELKPVTKKSRLVPPSPIVIKRHMLEDEIASDEEIISTCDTHITVRSDRCARIIKWIN